MKYQFINIIFICINFALLASETQDQQLELIIGQKIDLKVEEPTLNFSTAVSISSSNLPIPIANVKDTLQIYTSLKVFSTVDYALKVSFQPLASANLLFWDPKDILIISSEKFTTTLLWNGSEAAFSEILTLNGEKGYYEYFYSIYYARVNSLKKSGRLEGVVTFTMTANSDKN